MRILLLGKNGQLGWELERTLAPLGAVVAMGHAEADLSQLELLPKIVADVRPKLVVNAAAYTDVDRAESEPDQATVVNATAPGVLAEAARQIGAALIHFSTDYVFDGTKGAPYDESDEPNPINAYGRSKLDGEHSIQRVGGAYLILRTSWVYSLRHENFVTKVLRWARDQDEMRIVDDQIGSPTWARMLAEATSLAIGSNGEDAISSLMDHHGIYHVAGSGWASRYDLACAILSLDPKAEEHAFRELNRATTDEFPTAARRPHFLALNDASFRTTFGLGLPDWKVTMQMALEG